MKPSIIHLAKAWRFELDAPQGAPLGHKGGVPVGFRPPQAVVVVGGAHPEAPLLCQGGEQVEQAHGVRPAGHGAQHRAPPGQHIVFSCQGFDGFNHSSPSQRPASMPALQPRRISAAGGNQIKICAEQDMRLRSTPLLAPPPAGNHPRGRG